MRTLALAAIQMVIGARTNAGKIRRISHVQPQALVPESPVRAPACIKERHPWSRSLHFLPPGSSFDADSLAQIAEAFDKTCRLLHADSQPAFVKEVVASHIIALARMGRRNPDWLCDATLTALGRRPHHMP